MGKELAVKPDESLVRLGALARNAAAECSEIASAIDSLQEEIGKLMRTGNLTLDGRSIEKLQETDRLSQTLCCLARALERIDPELADLSIDRSELSGAIGLESVAARLLAD
ncbi:MAG: hypothetical protein AAGK37_01375 [Pseudomonadota bacterium]